MQISKIVIRNFKSIKEMNLKLKDINIFIGANGKNQFMKTSDGIIIAKKIGLETIRDKCNHFNDWITKIEKLVEE